MSLNQALRYSILTGIFLVPFIAFLVPPNMFFPFITGKNFIFRVLIEVLLGLYLVLIIRDKSFRPRFSWLLGVFSLFILVIGLADFLGENPFKSFWSNYERMEGFVTFLHLFAYFLVAGTILNTENLWIRFFQTSLGASILMSLYGVFQFFGAVQVHQGTTRIDASLGNATYLAIYAVLHIFLALFLFLRQRGNLGLRIFYITAFLLNLFVLYQTETRGAILGFAGGIFLVSLIIALFEKEDKRLKKISIGALILMVLLAGIFFFIKDSQFIKSSPTLDRLASISITDATSNPRFLIWGLAYEGFKERPILGWGQENFNYVFNKYYEPRLYPQEQWFDRTHNVILDWLIAGGLLGLLGYLSLYLLAIFYIWKKGEFSFKERAVLTGMFAAYFFHNLFVFDNLVSLLIFVSFLSYLHSHATRDRKVIFSFDSPNFLKLSAFPIGIVVAVLLIYSVNGSAYLANLKLIKAVVSVNQPDQALTFFKEALAHDSFGNQEIREQLMQFSVNIRNSASVNDTTKQEIFNVIVSEMNKAIENAPNDTRHRLFYGTVLDTYGQFDEGEKQLLEALRTSPRKQTVYFQLGSHYLNRGNKEKALEMFKIAYDSAPAFREAKIIYAMGAIYSNNLGLADQILGGEKIIDDRLISAYLANGFNGKAIDLAKAKIVENPNDLNFRLNLAALYYQMGDRTNAASVVREIISIDPTFKEKGEQLIKEIETGTAK